MSSAAIIDCTASVKLLKADTSAPSADLPKSVVFGMALNASMFFLASATSC
ncbi:hypothetical protein D3C72_2580350 [compost metagenome]